MNSEGHTYVAKNGKNFLVLEGSFTQWGIFLEKHHELKDGSFQCSITKLDKKKNLEKIEKGIFLILD